MKKRHLMAALEMRELAVMREKLELLAQMSGALACEFSKLLIYQTQAALGELKADEEAKPKECDGVELAKQSNGRWVRRRGELELSELVVQYPGTGLGKT